MLRKRVKNVYGRKADKKIRIGMRVFFVCVQIDQNSTGWTEAQLAKNLTAGTKFVVLSGGNGTLYSSAMYEVTSGDKPELILVGDVNGTKAVDVADFGAMAKHLANIQLIDNKYIDAAYVNDTGVVDVADFGGMARYLSGLGDLCCEYTNQKTNHVQITSAE